MTGDVAASYIDYAAEREDARFTDWLREQSEPAWTEATTHRFASELGAGTIDDEVMCRYLVQDYAFVETLVGTFGHAVGEAPSMAAKRRFTEFLSVLTADENDYFERSFEALGVEKDEYANPERTSTTEALVDLLERAAREGGYAETLAVLVPAEWVYLTWPTEVGDESPDLFYHAEWIGLHASESFRSFVEWLRTELDREGAAASDRRQEKLARLATRTVELEAAFFEAAYAAVPESPATASGGDA